MSDTSETIQLTLSERQSSLLLIALEMLDSDLTAAVDNSGDIEIVRDLWNSILDSGDEAGFSAEVISEGR